MGEIRVTYWNNQQSTGLDGEDTKALENGGSLVRGQRRRHRKDKEERIRWRVVARESRCSDIG